MVYQKAGWCANTFNRKWTGSPPSGLDFILMRRGCHGGAALFSLFSLFSFCVSFGIFLCGLEAGQDGRAHINLTVGCDLFIATRVRRLRGILLPFRDLFLFLLHQKLRSIQQRTAERGVVTGPGSLQLPRALELRPHGFHLGIEVVEIVQQQSLGKHRQFWRTEIVLTMVADDQVLNQSLQRVWEPW